MRSRQLMRILSVGFLAVSATALVSVAAPASSVEPALRQTDGDAKGIVSGVVKDKAGKPMANQLVRLHKPNPNDKPDKPANNSTLPGDADFRVGPGNQIARVVSDANGKFEFKDVPVGTYNIVATKPGMGFAKKENVTVNANQTTTIELQF